MTRRRGAARLRPLEGEMPTDPVERFVVECTLPPKQINMDVIPRLYEFAIEALERKYGEFTMETVRRLKDPIVKLMMTGRLAGQAWMRSDLMYGVRGERRNAINSLAVTHGWEVSAISELIGAPDDRLVNTAIDKYDMRNLPDWDEDTAKGVLVSMRDEIRRHQKAAGAALPIRNQLMRELSEGRWKGWNYCASEVDDDSDRLVWGWDSGRKKLTDDQWAAGERGRMWTNAELSRLAGMTTANAAILLRKLKAA